MTFRTALGALFVSLRLLIVALLPWSVFSRETNHPGYLEAPDVNHPFRSVRFTEWTLGFKQSSFHHTVRASTGVQLGGFAVPGLSEHARFPFDFRRQVGPVAQGCHAPPFPSCSGINSSRDAAHFVRARRCPTAGLGSFRAIRVGRSLPSFV